MKAVVGDELTVKGRHQGDGDRHGEIIEVHGQEGSPLLIVQGTRIAAHKRQIVELVCSYARRQVAARRSHS